MIDETKIQKIKETIEEFLGKMTIMPVALELTFPPAQPSENADIPDAGAFRKMDVIDAQVTIQDPQFLIGQNGQTLFELERILRIMLNKKLQENFYLNIDINNYKSKKIEYLKNLAKNLADEVVVTKEKKVLPPMPAYERRIIHKELDQRQDVTTQSDGEGENRHITISPAGSL